MMPDLHWNILDSLPQINNQTNLGVAGAFSGVSDNKLFVVGGANFPGKPAWENGPKKYYDIIYTLPFHHGKPGEWMDTLFHFPYPAAYGASVSTDQGFLCIGGKNDTGYISNVSLLQWDDKRHRVEITSLPSLPIPLASMAGARIDSTIYVAGGENKQGKQDCFYQLDLRHLSSGWETLPSLPNGALSDAQLISQSDGEYNCLYLIGGRAAENNGITNFYSAVYRFDPPNRKWIQCRNITGKHGKEVPLAAGTGIDLGHNFIVLVGGDNGILFNELAEYKTKAISENNILQKKYWEQRYDSLFINHPGFNRNVYLYNTVTDIWITLDSLPYPGPATTNIFRWDDKIIIPSGEIRPGVRTPVILSAKIVNNDN